MLQSNQVPEEAQLLLLPKFFYLTEELSNITDILEVKRKLTEVFTTYFVLFDHGSEMCAEQKDKYYNLFMSLHEVIDLISAQTVNEKAS